MSAVEAGVLTSLPVLAFAVFGALAPRLARLVGVHRLTTLALVGVVVGLYLRSRADEVWAFLALSLLSLAGHGDRQRAAAVAGEAPLPRPDRPDDVDLLDRPRDRADLGLRLHRADQRGVRRVALRPRGVGAPCGGRGGPLARPVPARPPGRPRDQRGQDRPRRGGPHPARLADGAVLRAAVAAGVLDLRLVRGGLPRRRLLRAHRRAAARGDHRHQHPALVRDSDPGSAHGQPGAADVGPDGLLPDRLPRADPRAASGRMGVGTRGRGRHLHVPADPDA